jgi:PAS domain S-box-containing protein
MDLITKFQEIRQKLESFTSGSEIDRELISYLDDFENLLFKYRNNIEEKLHEYKMLFENATDSIFIHTGSGKILAANATACRNYQYNADEIINLTISDIDTGKQHTNRKKTKELMKTGQTGFETSHRRKDGSTMEVEVNCRITTWDGQQVIASLCRDITRQKKTEADLREKEVKFKEIIQQTNDGIVVFNEQKKIVIWNKGAEKIIGLSARKAINQNLVDIQYGFVPPHLKDKKLIDSLLTGIVKLESPEIFNKIRDEEVVNPEFESAKFIETVLFPIKLQDYYLFGGVFRDITEKKNHEKQLLVLNANKDRFIQILAHDLRSPFNTLLGFNELLLANLHKYDKKSIEFHLNTQKRLIRKTFHLLEDLLLWSRSQLNMLEFHPGKIILGEIYKEVKNDLNSMAKSKNLTMHYWETEKVIMTGDKTMLETILRNLLINAIKFSNQQGVINTSVEKQTDVIIVTVADNGVGISDQNQAKLWDIKTTFTTAGTANEQGSGLGLIICKDLVERHGGTIWVESKPGKGSAFKFTLPLDSRHED